MGWPAFERHLAPDFGGLQGDGVGRAAFESAEAARAAAEQFRLQVRRQVSRDLETVDAYEVLAQA